MSQTKCVTSFLLGACTYLGLCCCVFFFQAPECQAKLIIDFQFADGSTEKLIPASGGSFNVNIVARTDNPLTTNLGIANGYIGALSDYRYGPLAADITWSEIIPGDLKRPGSSLGAKADQNGDGQMDLGLSNGAAKTTPGWMRVTTGSTDPAYLGNPMGVIGYFTITIPPIGSSQYYYLSYSPQLDPSGAGGDWTWREVASPAFITGSVTGDNPGTVIVGSSVTFSSVPEPATWSLFAAVVGAGIFSRRRRALAGHGSCRTATM